MQWAMGHGPSGFDFFYYYYFAVSIQCQIPSKSTHNINRIHKQFLIHNSQCICLIKARASSITVHCVCDILYASKNSTIPTENYDFGSLNKKEINGNGLNSNGKSMPNTWILVMMHTCLAVRCDASEYAD